MLVAANQEELGDIATWLDEHPSKEEMVEAGIGEEIKPRLDALLTRVINERDADAYPVYVPVPHDLAPLLDLTIEDWSEVLTSHDEELLTDLVSVEA
jgi:hypothetical protein